MWTRELLLVSVSSLTLVPEFQDGPRSVDPSGEPLPSTPTSNPHPRHIRTPGPKTQNFLPRVLEGCHTREGRRQPVHEDDGSVEGRLRGLL